MDTKNQELCYAMLKVLQAVEHLEHDDQKWVLDSARSRLVMLHTFHFHEQLRTSAAERATSGVRHKLATKKPN